MKRTRALGIAAPASIGLVAAIVAIAPGCGERSFSAEEFVDEVNGNGATLELGGPLVTSDKSKDLFEVRLEPLEEEVGAEEPTAGGEHAHSGGSIAVYEEGEDAEEGVQECEAAADLLCYRAANVVVVLEGPAVGPEQVALAGAVKELAD